ncbi:MAG: BON domain-containing protein [Desulfobacteraceae bacterium]|nr:BON domain-containing protein [Desulfobacteraceae bacterium]
MTIFSISMGTFGGGKAVAKGLAEKLDYVCIGREDVIRDAAVAFDMKESQLRSAILTVPGFLALGASDHIANVKFLRAALVERTIGNNLVYHGYGGHLLLDGVPNLLRVRVIAGMEYRIAIVMDKDKLSREKAVQHIIENDKQRANWARTVWGGEWNDPSKFDLMVNLDHIEVAGAVDLIIKAAELVEFNRDYDTNQAFEDERILAKIWVALTRNRPTRAARIQLDSKKGCVTITGDVGSVKLKDAIVGIAGEVPGVNQVVSHLSVGAAWQW